MKLLLNHENELARVFFIFPRNNEKWEYIIMDWKKNNIGNFPMLFFIYCNNIGNYNVTKLSHYIVDFRMNHQLG